MYENVSVQKENVDKKNKLPKTYFNFYSFTKNKKIVFRFR